jgi:hypothetical protein
MMDKEALPTGAYSKTLKLHGCQVLCTGKRILKNSHNTDPQSGFPTGIVSFLTDIFFQSCVIEQLTST